MAPVTRQALAIFPLAPMKKEDAPTPELAEAWEYYHTQRAQYLTAPGYMTRLASTLDVLQTIRK